ncbi:MAG TPA: hypothetical protein VFR05_11635, partial [Terriglobia bacterium]|nr:hypothetical protein [Terriglobia bacterium]
SSPSPITYNPGMLRPLLLAVVVGLLLCAACVINPHPVDACTSDAQPSNPKQPQLDVLPATSNPTSVKLQAAPLPWVDIQPSTVELEERAVRISRLSNLTSRESVKASTVLRI